eukprot:jgi/Galph1/5553/GphlegSOOS_G4154.1
MTTAHRPTWNPAKGGNEQGGFRLNVPSAKVSSRDMPGHLTLKSRAVGQGAKEELETRDLKRELLEKEEKHWKKLKTEHKTAEETVQDENDVDADVWLDDDVSEETSEPQEENSSVASEDDEEQELLRELERIKKEREEEKRRKEQEEQQQREEAEINKVMRSNPLLNFGEQRPSFQVKRRWDDDVVFRRQNQQVVNTEPRFINDTVRNDFHRKFLERYIK